MSQEEGRVIFMWSDSQWITMPRTENVHVDDTELCTIIVNS